MLLSRAAAPPRRHVRFSAMPRAFPSPAELQGALFDIDGTLTDSDHIHFAVFKDFLAEHNALGGVLLTPKYFRAHISGGANETLFATLFPGASAAECAALAEDKEARFRELAKNELRPLPGLLSFTQALAARGVKCIAVTNAPRANAELMLRALGLDDFFGPDFALLVIGSECAFSKPHPAPYIEGLRRLGVAAEHAVAFEDSPGGLASAVAANLATYGLTTSQVPETLLRIGAGACVRDYTDAALWAAAGVSPPTRFE